MSQKTNRGAVTMEIDADKLQEVLKANGYTAYTLERELGCGMDITNAVHRGRIRKPLLLLLESKFNETFDPVIEEPDNEPETAKEITITITQDQWNNLFHTINSAVREAVKEALK